MSVTRYIAVEEADTGNIYVVHAIDDEMAHVWLYAPDTINIYDTIARIEMGDDDKAHQISGLLYPAAATLLLIAKGCQSPDNRYTIIADYYRCYRDRPVDGIDAHLHGASASGLRALGITDTASVGNIRRCDVRYTAVEATDGTILIYGRDDKPAWAWQRTDGGDSLIDGLCRCVLQGTSPGTTMATTEYTGDISSLYRLPVIAEAYTEDQGADQYITIYPWRASAAMRRNMGITTCDTTGIWIDRQARLLRHAAPPAAAKNNKKKERKSYYAIERVGGDGPIYLVVRHGDQHRVWLYSDACATSLQRAVIMIHLTGTCPYQDITDDDIDLAPQDWAEIMCCQGLGIRHDQRDMIQLYPGLASAAGRRAMGINVYLPARVPPHHRYHVYYTTDANGTGDLKIFEIDDDDRRYCDRAFSRVDHHHDGSCPGLLDLIAGTMYGLLDDDIVDDEEAEYHWPLAYIPDNDESQETWDSYRRDSDYPSIATSYCDDDDEMVIDLYPHLTYDDAPIYDACHAAAS